MTIHRIDFAIDLLGPIRRVTGAVARYADRAKTEDGKPCPPSDVDDWSCLIGEFDCGAVGLWEGTTLAKGYHREGVGHDWAEINGAEGSAVYQLHDPNHILLGKHREDLEPVPVPFEFLTPAGSPRDPHQGRPSTVFRYDLMWEFVSAIMEQRDAVPSFYHGWRAQVVADAVLESCARRCWVEIPAD
jgi:predicted dehydrogenase